MGTEMPTLETERLRIRPLAMDDLGPIHHVLSAAWGEPENDETLAARERWLRWTVANYEELAALVQPPYGDRAIVRRDTGVIVGGVGFVPLLAPFGQLPGFPAHQGSRRWFTEFGMFWAIDPQHQGQGYATEAARAMIDFAFEAFNLGRILAGTEYDNEASMGVMRKLGMRILRNPFDDPPWFQVTGILERP